MKITSAICALAWFCGAAQAQTADGKLSFEAASVKPSPPPDGRGMSVGMHGGPGTPDPERVSFENFGLAGLIGIAYDLKFYQILGAPPFDSQRFNVIGTLAPNSTKEQFRLMLQNLLAERFQLRVHKEKREMPIYALTVAKGGSKLKSPAADPNDAGAGKDDVGRGAVRLAKDADGFPVLTRGTTMAATGNRARLGGRKQPISMLVDQLSGQSGRPVVDETGLRGEYDFTLSWVPNPNAPNADSLPDLFTALQQQLGLKLEAKKGPVEVLVVDHADKMPAGN